MKRAKKPSPPAPPRAPDVDAETMRAAAKAALDARIAAQQRAKQAWSPHLDSENVPPGYRVRGTSVLRDGDGNVRLVWHKTTSDAIDPFELGEKIAAGLAAGGLKPIEAAPPPIANAELLSVYPLGDPHIGLYAWRDEVGESFDLDIAAQRYLTAFELLLPRAPEGSDALLIELGDFFHADDPEYKTSSGRHTVDVDTRYHRVISTGTQMMVGMIDALLVRHANVEIWILRGNHDNDSAIGLDQSIRMAFRDNPRVTVRYNPGKHYGREFGKSLIAATHGDTLRGKRGRTMHEIVTTDYREAWGRTKHARAYVGHVHHESVSEVGELVTETFRTLAPKDAWHAAKGYRSGRDTRLDVWHREYGLRTREILTIDEIKDAIELARTIGGATP